MRHSSSRQLFDYWNERRGSRAAPLRADIDPAAIRHALGDVFILAADFVDEHRFRLAGTRLCALFNRELKGESLVSLCAEASRIDLRRALTQTTAENAGIVAGLTGANRDGDPVALELLLLPLAHQGHARIRAIGALVALETPYWIGDKPLTQLKLGTVRTAGDGLEDDRAIPIEASGGYLRRGLMVYQGGLISPANEKAG